MKVLRTIAEMRSELHEFRKQHPQATVGFVPTMGYLHGGHESLLQRARQDCDLAVASIFVNPLQFGPNEDYEQYPRDEERDLSVCERAGIDIVFKPEPLEMYPSPMLTKVSVKQVTEGLCGASRPGHFDGVCTVVAKLFHIVQPDHAYFGMKDAQQVAVIMQMVADLNMPVNIIPCPTLREEDGLAMSSRNVYLSAEERKQAPIIYQALSAADEFMKNVPEGTIGEWVEYMKQKLKEAPLANVEYVEAVGFPSLRPLDEQMKIYDVLQTEDLLAACAVKFGKTRLIDNRLWSREGGEATCIER